MSETAGAIFKLSVILGALGAVAAAFFFDRNTDPMLRWGTFALCGALVLVPVLLAIRAAMRRDALPNLLFQFWRDAHFSRDGFSFAIQPSLNRQTFEWVVFFQNGYSEPCRARVLLQSRPPAARSFRFAGDPIISVSIPIECDGGAFGVIRVPVGIPPEFQGNQERFQVSVAVRFSEARGKLLIAPKGKRCSSATFEFADAGSAVLSLTAFFAGIITFSVPAHIDLQLPKGVEATPPSPQRDPQRILWRPNDAIPAAETLIEAAAPMGSADSTELR